MTPRSFALVLAMTAAVTPLVRGVCEIACVEPPATASLCHKTDVPKDGATLQGATHVCDHDHAGASPALLASSAGRDSVMPFAATAWTTAAHALLCEARAAAAAIHGPPGPSGGSTSFSLTILRI